MDFEKTTRPLTEGEKDYYSTLKEHYTERSASEPDNRFLRGQLSTISKIVKDGTIPTITALPGIGLSFTD